MMGKARGKELIDQPSEAPSGPVVSSGNRYLNSLDLL